MNYSRGASTAPVPPKSAAADPSMQDDTLAVEQLSEDKGRHCAYGGELQVLVAAPFCAWCCLWCAITFGIGACCGAAARSLRQRAHLSWTACCNLLQEEQPACARTVSPVLAAPPPAPLPHGAPGTWHS